MNPKQTGGVSPPGMSLGDVYYIMFRRKWVIIVCSLCGFVAAGITYLTGKPKYSSTAELYISDIIQVRKADNRNPEVVDTPTGNSGNLLLSEVEILRSLDNLKTVAEILTPAKVMLGDVSGTNVSVDRAAQQIGANLTVETPERSQVIVVTYSSPAIETVQPVLEQVITNYIKQHILIHLPPTDENLQREYTVRQNDLKETEDKIRDLKITAGIVGDIKDEAAQFKQQEGVIEQEYLMACGELAESLARAEDLKSLLPATNQAPATNATAAAVIAAPSESTLNDYKEAKKRLEELQTKQAALENVYTTNNMLVQTNLLEIQVFKDKVRKLEDENPGLLAKVKEDERERGGPAGTSSAEAAFHSEIVRIKGLMARTNECATRLELFQERGTNLIRLEPVIEELERDKALKADMLNKVSTETYALKIEGVAEKYRGENITEIQHPSPPSRSNSSKKLNEAAGGIAAGGVALGFGLAFLWELLLDRSLRRQKEVVERLKLPVFLNVPFMKNGKERIASLKPGGKVELLAGGGSGDGGASGNGGGEVVAVGNGPPALWGDEHAMRPFHDTLRDRLVANFEMLNLTHKPKLVAVTSCGDGAGVSTIAAGLARSLSETGEGNVLLVDMNSGDGVAHHFSKGKLAMGLDDILENEKENRQGALVQENLYVVQEMNNRDKLPGALPKRFGHLVTQLKASDYDYILLDMPPVTEISITPRLARFMDTILLVVESEVTDRDAAQRAAALLSEGRTNVGVVINKTRTYVPKRLHHEI